VQFVDLGLAEDPDHHVNDSFCPHMDPTRYQVQDYGTERGVFVLTSLVTCVTIIRRSGETRAARTVGYGSIVLPTASGAALGPTQLPVQRTSGKLSRG
jgi:hypothetical protein